MILKLTCLMLAACTADFMLRRASAAMRHLMWSLSMAASLLLPLGSLYVPRVAGSAFVIRTSAVGSALAMPAKLNWLMAIYAAGVVVFLARLVLDVLAANRLVREARASSLPGVLIVDRATVPFAWGSIVIPAGFEKREAVLAHEAAHLERGDMWTSLLARLACAVYWFHPLIWWANYRLRLEADRACDDAVLRHGFGDAGYAEDLVSVAANLGPAGGLVPGAVRQSQVEMRVRHILASGVDRRKLGAVAACVAVLMCLAVVSPLAALTQRADDKVYRLGKGMIPPRVLAKVEPAYPREARKAKISGTVLLSLVVGSDGVARDIEVVRHLDPGFDKSAVNAVQGWKFQPAVKDGAPVSVKATIEVNFRLK
jgi:TonB family protein